MISRGVASFTTSLGRELFARLTAGKEGPVIQFFSAKGELTATAYYAATLCGRDGTPPPKTCDQGMSIAGGSVGEFFDLDTTARLIHFAAGVADCMAWMTAEAEIARRDRKRQS